MATTKYTIASNSDMTAPPAIGATTPSTGKFTTLQSTGTTTLGATTASTLDNTIIGSITPVAGNFTSVSATSIASTSEPTAGGAGIMRGLKNLLVNPDFSIAQLGTSVAASNDTYSLDQWNYLGEDVGTISQQSSSPPAGARYYARVLVTTANKQSALVQFLEAERTIKEWGNKLTFSFKLKQGAGAIVNLRAAIIGWSGTADSLTSAVIGAWAQDGTNPTLAANWSYLSTPVNLALSASFQAFTVTTDAVLATSVNNGAVIVWVDDGTIAGSSAFDIGVCQLERGTVATSFVTLPPAMNFEECQKFYEVCDATCANSNGGATGVIIGMTRYAVKKRVAPTLTTLKTAIIANNTVAEQTSGNAVLTVTLTGTTGASFYWTDTAPGWNFVTTLPAVIKTDACLAADARL